jgi:hypothetical protein
MASIFDVSPTYIVGWTETSSNPLSAEVKVLQGVKLFYGADAVDLLEVYTSLSKCGRSRLFQYANDMSELYGKDM